VRQFPLQYDTSKMSFGTILIEPAHFGDHRGFFGETYSRRQYAELGINVEKMGRRYAWLDTGTHALLLDASNFVWTLTERQGLQIGSPDETAYQMNWITKEQLCERTTLFGKNKYGQHLIEIGKSK